SPAGATVGASTRSACDGRCSVTAAPSSNDPAAPSFGTIALSTSPPRTRTWSSNAFPRNTARSTRPGSLLSPAVPCSSTTTRTRARGRVPPLPVPAGPWGPVASRKRRLAPSGGALAVAARSRMTGEQVGDAEEVAHEPRPGLLVHPARRADLVDAPAVHDGDS